MLKTTIQANGTVILPKDLRNKFNPKEELLVETNNDAIILKRTRIASLTEISKRLKSIGRKITPKEVTAEITAYRSLK